MKLNEKQKRFCHEYAVDLNATQAAIRAGYSAKTSGSMAFDLLKKPDIQSYIQKLRQEREQKTGFNAQWALERLMIIADVDVRQLFDSDGRVLRPDKLPDDLAKTIAGFEIGDTIKVKLSDRLRAIEMACRLQGLFVDRVQTEVRQFAEVKIYLPDNGRDTIDSTSSEVE
jgi:phage terminase small subunit